MIVSEKQVLNAMAYWEAAHIREHGPLDGVTLPRNCARLADLLGAMWFAKDTEAQLPDDSPISRLILCNEHTPNDGN